MTRTFGPAPKLKLAPAPVAADDAGKRLENIYAKSPARARIYIDGRIAECTSYSDIQELVEELQAQEAVLVASESELKSDESWQANQWYEPEEEACEICYPHTLKAQLERILDYSLAFETWTDRFCAYSRKAAERASSFMLLACSLCLIVVSEGFNPLTDWRQFALLSILGAMTGIFTSKIGWALIKKSFARKGAEKEKASASLAPPVKLQLSSVYDECPNCLIEAQYLWVPGEQSLTCIQCGHSLEFKRYEGVDHETH